MARVMMAERKGWLILPFWLAVQSRVLHDGSLGRRPDYGEIF
jgi:hypothetical protein